MAIHIMWSINNERRMGFSVYTMGSEAAESLLYLI